MSRAAAVVALAGAVAFSSCTDGLVVDADRTSLLTSPGVPWLILVYMAPGGEHASAVIDTLNRMESVGLAGTGVVVSVLATGARSRLYEVADDPVGSDAVVSIPLESGELGLHPDRDAALDAGDPGTLGGFLRFARDRYRPERAALFFWGTGRGVRAPIVDPVSGGELSAAAIADVVASVPLASSGTLDVVGFDSAFTAGIELAYEMRRCAKILVASQGSMPPSGWDYEWLLRRFLQTDRSPAALAAAIVESAPGFTSAPDAMSAVDLRAAERVNAALNAFSDAVFASIPTDLLRRSVRYTLFYDLVDFYATPGDLAIDIADLGAVVAANHGIAGDEAAELQDAVRSAVLATWSRGGRASGVSVHLIPLESDGSAAGSHHAAWFRGYHGTDRLAFTECSHWTIDGAGGHGLLYRLFYEVLP
ncbi:MAG: hypothetical protein EA382_02330 [Spirochaetaceae bacterium]|nr:MAG: hypothetical protein EA382_02330 [Spirochaetaceae bacterium]